MGSHYSEEDQELKKRHALLTADLTKTLSNIGHLHNDIKRLQKDITSTGVLYILTYACLC